MSIPTLRVNRIIPHKLLHYGALACLLVSSLVAGFTTPAAAQSSLAGFSTPINLSQSGAASQPQIVAAPDGGMQIFWWDQFDGLTTSIYDGETWSAPVQAALTPWRTPPGDLQGPLNLSPVLVADQHGWVHAFWVETGIRPELIHSQMPIGTTQWSTPERLDDAILDYTVAVAPNGEISVAFVHTQHSSDYPAGIYLLHSDGGGAAWGLPKIVYPSIYFRLVKSGEVTLNLSDSGNGTFDMVWNDPHLNQVFYSYSLDYGNTWSEYEALTQPGDPSATPRVTGLKNGTAIRLWMEGSLQNECKIYQQRVVPGKSPQEDARWTEPEQVLSDVTLCPRADTFWPLDSGLFWLWGQSSNSLTLAAWDTNTNQWSAPKNLLFSFEDQQMSRPVSLTDLHAAFSNDLLTVVGMDLNMGEVWVTTAQSKALDLVFAPPSPWSAPIRLSAPGEKTGDPAVAVDSRGRAHVVWSQGTGTGSDSYRLVYALWENQKLAGPLEIVRADTAEIARQPSLLCDAQDELHLVWSGGPAGNVQYRKANSSEASSLSGWSAPVTLSQEGVASYPQIKNGAGERLYVVYAVPFNEKRGIYLVQSEDGGNTWATPVQIFDAERAGWESADRPSLEVTPDGVLHAAWVQSSPPGTWASGGIFYARSTDAGQTWSSPLAMTGVGFDAPHLALSGGQMHLLFTDSQNGGVWQRWATAGSDTSRSAGWSVAAKVPGWQGTRTGFGVAVDGSAMGGVTPAGAPVPSTLHLVGSDLTLEMPMYNTWDGSKWSSVEAFSVEVFAQDGGAEKELAAAAATRPNGGVLAVAWIKPSGIGSDQPLALYLTVRQIPTIDVSEAIVAEATPTPTPSPTPAATSTVQPTPTPSLKDIPPLPSASTFPPLAFGGGLAALIVVVILVSTRIINRNGS